jgi:hypothetical protein
VLDIDTAPATVKVPDKLRLLGIAFVTIREFMFIVMPLSISVAVAGVLAALAQFGFLFTTKAIVPDLKKSVPDFLPFVLNNSDFVNLSVDVSGVRLEDWVYVDGKYGDVVKAEYAAYAKERQMRASTIKASAATMPPVITPEMALGRNRGLAVSAAAKR